MTDRVLGVFAKEPVPGRVKTRLAAATSPAWAARVADACLRDSLTRLALVEAQRWLLFDPPEAAPSFAALAGTSYLPWPQAAGDLGTRLAEFFRAANAVGGQRIVAIGADSPTLPIAFVEEAYARLRYSDVVFGPARDGGYYLIGCSRWLPELFEDVPWGSSTVLAVSSKICVSHCLSHAYLPPWYDVDTHEDWQLLAGQLLASRALGQATGCQHLEALLIESE